eukprot:jgi/Bigna1/85290/estExt_fgenesh1_pg.C_30157
MTKSGRIHYEKNWEGQLGACGYINKAKVQAEVKEVLYQTKSLQPVVEAFVFNDGKMTNLLTLKGTIPIYYKGHQYNIPVKLCITKEYPQKAPIAYVTPTKDMRIHRGHPNVNESGSVYMSYPIWQGGSNLVTLIIALSESFSKKPPVYRATTAQRRPPQYRQQPQQAFPVARPVARPRSSSESLCCCRKPTSNPYADPKAQRKEQLLRKAREALTTNTIERLSAQTEEINRLIDYEFKLKQNKLTLARGKAEMEHEKKLLETSIAAMDTQNKTLNTWISENKNKDVDVDAAIDGRDTWSKQILDEVAKDSAIEDALYALDKALEDGRITLDVFLKQVRRLSKQQFQHRALTHKIMEQQQQKRAMEM